MFLVLAFRADHPFDPAYRFPLTDRCVIVGRGPEVMTFPLGNGQRRLAVPDLGISRNHCDLRPDPDGSAALVVTDLGSTNGLVLDGEPLTHGRLLPGSLLEIGSCFFVLVEADAPADSEAGCVAFASTTDPSLEQSIARFAPYPDPVVLLGEVGAGAQPLAEDLHTRRRASGPFVVYDGGELAAAQARATGGTLFVRDLEALGMNELRDLRIAIGKPMGPRLVIGAANQRSLGVLGSFASQLAMRAIRVPPLSQRRHDVGRLVSLALSHALRRAGRDGNGVKVTRKAARMLLSHPWPGGYAELAAACDLAVSAMTGDALELSHLPTWLRRQTEDSAEVAPASETAPLMVDVPADFLMRASPAERASTLRALLTVFGGNVTALARWIGRSRRQMHRWLATEAIDADAYRRA